MWKNIVTICRWVIILFGKPEEEQNNNNILSRYYLINLTMAY